MTGMDKIERTLRALKIIQKSTRPKDPLLIDGHNQKLEKASNYIVELQEFTNLHPNEFTIVAESTFQRLITRSDFVEIEELGYIRIASVKNYPETEFKNYVWLTPITDL